ncbi:MAG TPA: type II toxin-antitoxin system VapC family toxin [Gemmataceae bacterium]|nr:type II toxin-antitoxin system VapC family toxin [Gemmataceae bacterium]
MNRYVLDTDILTLFQEGHPAVLQHLQKHSPDQRAISIITVEEELRGWYTKLRRANKPRLLASAYQRLADAVGFFSKLAILSFTESAIARYEQLRIAHKHVGKNDLRIAAIVLEHGDILVTRNVKDFQGISSLKIEDWSK